MFNVVQEIFTLKMATAWCPRSWYIQTNAHGITPPKTITFNAHLSEKSIDYIS
jgi:hypothetical protein